MNLINSILTTIGEWALLPVSRWPLLVLIVLSALTGALMTLVFRYTSNQKALRNVIDRSRGHFLAIKLFKDDLGGMFDSLLNILRLAAARLWYSLSPVLVMVIPLLFLLTQMALWYEHRPLQIGESTVVELRLSEDAWRAHQEVKLESFDQIAIETEPLRDEETRAVYWRIKPNTAGQSKLRWQLGSTDVEKEIVVGDGSAALAKVSVRRAGSNFVDQFLNPGESAFDEASPVTAVEVHYPRRANPVLGWRIPWWLTFFAVSILFALIMQPVLKVRF